MINTGLIGYTGFVGSNLLQSMNFTHLYNSRNIHEINNLSFDKLFCCGTPAQKWLANENPQADLKNINTLLYNLKTVKAKQFILISTIDVYNTPINVDENTDILYKTLDGYGSNRYYLENEIKKLFKNTLIVRLPGLYGKNLKKNFLYDLINPIPKFINNTIFKQIETSLSPNEKLLLNQYYQSESLGFNLNENFPKGPILSLLKSINSTSLMFTDCRSTFQFYNLDNLSKDINIALNNQLNLINISTYPLSASYISKEICSFDFNNIIENKCPAIYDFKSLYCDIYEGENGYLYSKENVILEIRNFLKENSNGYWNI